MLVLTRKVNESIVIGGQVMVTVTRLDARKVSLGITAPGNVEVLRAEIPPEEPVETTPALVSPKTKKKW